jgi:hypothetical protein
LVAILPVHSFPSLELTVTTDKPAYRVNEAVQIYGNLTFDGSIVTDGLVGIQIESPGNQLVTIRTVNTGTNPTQASYVLVNALFPCDATGDPKDNFQRGTLAYFRATVSNYDIESRHVLITINTYYPNNIPFGLASIETTLTGQSVSSTIISIPISTDASIGNAIAYADAYSGWPKLGGTPYCVGKSATFQITSGSALQAPTTQNSKTETTLSLDGNYNLTLQLTPKVDWGIYTIYVSSIYFGEETYDSATFRVRRLGDLDDDGDVDWWDLLLFRQIYIDGYNIDADLDFDSDVDYWDLYLFRQEYVKA